MSRALYIIRSIESPEGAWSNKFGWTDDDTRDVYGERERQTLRLPVGGYWERLPEDYGADESSKGAQP